MTPDSNRPARSCSIPRARARSSPRPRSPSPSPSRARWAEPRGRARAFDPVRRRLYVNVNEVGALGGLLPLGPGAPCCLPAGRLGRRIRALLGRQPLALPAALGHLNAIDLDAGTGRLTVPLGVVDALVARGVPPTGTPSPGGSIATVGGLVFIAGTNDARLRAFDADSGRELWADRLEASGHATPMTYRGKSGQAVRSSPPAGRLPESHHRGRRGRRTHCRCPEPRRRPAPSGRATIAPCPRRFSRSPSRPCPGPGSLVRRIPGPSRPARDAGGTGDRPHRRGRTPGRRRMEGLRSRPPSCSASPAKARPRPRPPSCACSTTTTRSTSACASTTASPGGSAASSRGATTWRTRTASRSSSTRTTIT